MSRDKILFTPGPITTSQTVKQAMLRDLGSRDFEFITMVKDIRRKLLALAEVGEPGYVTVPVQGSGTFALEAVVASAIPPRGKLLVVVNGAYGKRLVKIASVLQVAHASLDVAEDTVPEAEAVGAALERDPEVTHVAVVHCETTTGIMNPVAEIGKVVKQAGRLYVVDAMSSFGAVPMNMAKWGIDYLVSSANKCIEGVPGFSFVLARREALLATEGFARSLSLDLLSQWKGLEGNGQFRFTPPTHAFLAFHQALRELEEEGGVEARGARYRENQRTLVEGMRSMGFREYLRPELQGPIITSFHYPDDPGFSFEDFYEKLNRRDCVIYPGKLSRGKCFRIGTVGRIFPRDVKNLLAAVEEAVKK